jgi:hypothetical protein
MVCWTVRTANGQFSLVFKWSMSSLKGSLSMLALRFKCKGLWVPHLWR